jgi:hypothetical protein
MMPGRSHLLSAKTGDQKFDGVAAFAPNKSTMLWFSFARSW